jgi:general secretion pathway protein B
MSYILDALRKADAERERGTVPGINAQPMFAGSPPLTARRATRPKWLWVVAVVALVLAVAVAALAWTMFGNGAGVGPAIPAAELAKAARVGAASTPLPVTPAPVTATTAPSASTAIVAAAPSQSASIASDAASAAIASRAARAEPKEAAAPRKPKAVPAASASKPAANKPSTDSNEANVASKTRPKDNAQATAATPAAAESRVYTIKELPDDIRRQLPAFAVGASIYSNTPANRILIINGQVLHEGESVITGLVLEQIKLKAAVLAFKGYRFIITY